MGAVFINGTKQPAPATIHELLFAKTEMKYCYTYNWCYNFTGISGIIQITEGDLIMDTLGFVLATGHYGGNFLTLCLKFICKSFDNLHQQK